MAQRELIDFNKRRIGLELENLLVRADSSLVDAAIVQNIWQDFIASGWKPKRDSITNEILATHKTYNGQDVVASTDGSLATFELALPPLDSLSEEEQLLKTLHKEILPIFKKHNVRLLGIGLNPGITNVSDAYLTPKSFYKTVKRFWHLFNLGFGTAANQTNVSLRLDETTRCVNALAPIGGLIMALTANSPVAEWKQLRWKEFRHPLFSKLFSVTDYRSFESVVCNPQQQPFRSLSHYLGSFFDAKPFMIITPMRDGQFVVLDQKVTWLEYLKGKEWAGVDLAGTKKILRPEVSDINMAMNNQWYPAVLHMTCDENKTTVSEFVDALERNTVEHYLQGRLKNLYIEYRVASAQLKHEEFNCPALILGLIENVAELEVFVARYSWDEWLHFADRAAIFGMEAKMHSDSCREMLVELVDIARAGLLKRNFGEEKYMDVLEERIKTGRAPADDVLEQYKSGDKETLLEYLSYV